MEREEFKENICNLFINEQMKRKDMTFIVYKECISKLLINLPIDIARANHKLLIKKLRSENLAVEKKESENSKIKANENEVDKPVYEN